MFDLSFVKNFYFPENVLEFLASPILGINPILDYWSIIHLISGVILGYVLLKTNQKKSVAYTVALVLLVLYEGFEQLLFSQALAVPEPMINILLDVAIGMLGVLLILRGKK